MNIEAKGFSVELSYSELWDIGCDLRRALKCALEKHWVKHQESWERNEEKRLGRLKYIFSALNRSDMYDQIFIEAKEIFENFNNSKS